MAKAKYHYKHLYTRKHILANLPVNDGASNFKKFEQAPELVRLPWQTPDSAVETD